MYPKLRVINRALICGFAAALFVGVVNGQSPAGPPSESNHFIETPKGWTQPKTPWGDPDIQGMWPISYVGSVPLERCKGGGRTTTPVAECDVNKAFWTEAEYRERVDAASKRVDRHAEAIAKGDFGEALQTGVTDPTAPQRQTSLIVDPPNGQLPGMTAEGKRLSALMKSSWALRGEETQTWDTYLDFDSWDRCITRGMPSSMMPYRYNNGVRIIQTPGYVILDMEMVHETRIVPVDGRPPLSSKIKHWMGESRGRWEGNTLVIETTNFRTGPSATNIGVMGSPDGNRFPVSEQMKTTERISRLNNDFLLYEIKTEDPIVLTRPWTARYPLKLDPSYEWWEYGCHEGNRTIPDYINASRAERAKQSEAK